MPKFNITETTYSERVLTARLGTNTVALGGGFTDKEVGKAAKLVAESRFALAAVGEPIEATIGSVNLGVFDGFSIGAVVARGYKDVTFDGLQATPGTGAVALGDFVVTGTVTAVGTALAAPVRVCKGTIQPGITVATVIGDVAPQINAAKFMWRVVSLGNVGTGAVGTTGVIERV